VEDLTERRRLEARERFIRETFQRYVSPAVVQRLLEDPSQLKLGGTRQEISILFADIRGFTSFSEHRDPESLVEVLNHYLSIGADAVLTEDGTLDKFVGDAIMAIFNAPLSQPDHTLRAVRAALLMQKMIGEHHHKVARGEHLAYGAGIAVGEAVVGNIGTAQQLNYTAIGASVNLAKRLQENAVAGQILIHQDAYERVKEYVQVKSLEPMKMKGFNTPIQAHELLGLR
jgi:class 3 adenylate cyclase